ncbi:DUF6745 domain-containing protein [Streptosporangium sp. NBC_01756]|uniref:DUF6745 domain-containing protein n=1 Tax=Streptosporangium sp. NBC_01756 TaxID=2975950 RepID=UPI002DD959D1|nr:hypothetical protein [Streptosporangium sp. NBC_01756]WSC90466.1 hypothetical protein OIE48_20515 [Streptosporangium sp. NBC_01756]
MSALVQREAAEIREEWLGRALSTLPADRPAAEAAISELYHLIGLAPPRFHWVPSPVAALTTVPPGVRSRPSKAAAHTSEWPLPPRFSALMRELCRGLDAQVRWVHQPMDRLIRQEVRSSLSQSTSSSLLIPVRAAHDAQSYPGSGWYGTQCVSWIAHYDALRRAAGVVFTPEQTRQLDLWAAAARSSGWWWPHEDVCVISERPVAVHTEVWGDDGEVRLHCADGPAVRYADGWDAYSWHGTQVPSWVITDPSVQRIAAEGNVEVRRCAIEHIGWASYIGQAGLRLVAAAPDPGNPGSELRLFDMRKETRVLLAVNGSLERDGRRRRYGLTVPGFFDDPIAAAGWTYGLSAEQYSLLVRRT